MTWERTGPQGQRGRLLGVGRQSEQLFGEGALAYQGEQGLAEPSRFLESLCGEHGGHPVLAATEGSKRPHQGDPPLLAGVEPVVAQGQQPLLRRFGVSMPRLQHRVCQGDQVPGVLRLSLDAGQVLLGESSVTDPVQEVGGVGQELTRAQRQPGRPE